MRPDKTRWELINHLANKDSQMGEAGDITQVLKSAQEPIGPKELSETHPITREKVHEITEPLEPWGVESLQDGRREITTAGEIARRSYKEAIETINPDDLAWLARSENRGEILDELRTTGATSAKKLSEEVSADTRTIRRNYEQLDDRDWNVIDCEDRTRDRSKVATLTMEGERVSRTYSDLLLKIEQVIDKAPCLRDLGLECANIPVKALAGEEMVEATPEHPLQIEKRVRKLSNVDFQHFRGFQSHWNGENAKAYHSAVRDGKQFEIVSPPLGLDALPTDAEEVKCVVEGLQAENYQWLMYSGELPCSLAILDRDQMVVGPRDPGTANRVRTGAVVSSNDKLIKWALKMYETHRQQTRDPFDVSVGFSIGVEDLIELLRNRYLEEDDEGTASG